MIGPITTEEILWAGIREIRGRLYIVPLFLDVGDPRKTRRAAIQTVENETKDSWTRIEDFVSASEGSVRPRPVFIAISEPEIPLRIDRYCLNRNPEKPLIDLDNSRCYDLRVRLELPIIQHVSYFLRVAFLSLLLALLCLPANAQPQKPKLPDPIKYVNTYDIVANVVHAVLDEMGFKIELEDRAGGRIVTRPHEFITGSLTSSEVDKVAVKRPTITGEWLKARYSVEAILERVSRTETMVTIHTRMEALNRDVDGTERWIPLDSLGTYEKRILGKISAKLMGNEAPPEKKGFWGKSPQPVPTFPTGPTR